MSVEPDFEGFRQAQVTLREKFGRAVEFFTPLPSSWPVGTKINPETGRPYDPSIHPLASGFSSGAVIASIVDRPMGLSRSGTEDSRVATAIGNLSETGKVFIIGPDDVGPASGATRARYLEEEFKVTDVVPDALGPVERWLIFVERR